MKRLGCGCVHLNITHQPAEFVREHFPTIYQRCLEFGIDIARDRISGGTGGALHLWRRSDQYPGRNGCSQSVCYWHEKTSFSGLHGANRMASNSLLECFVVAFGAARHIAPRIAETPLVTGIADSG